MLCHRLHRQGEATGKVDEEMTDSQWEQCYPFLCKLNRGDLH